MIKKQKIKGRSQVIRNIGKAKAKIVDKAIKALTVIGVEVRSRGMKITPVDKGNLINSWYGPVITVRTTRIVCEIGLTASYAPYVHEMIEATFQKPGASAKFLEKPLKEVEAEILKELGKFISVSDVSFTYLDYLEI